MFEDAERVSASSRAEAFAGGVLLDVSERAKRWAIHLSVAMTAGVYRALTQRAGTEPCKQLCIDLLLLTIRQQIRHHPPDPTIHRLDFAVKIPHRPSIRLHALCHPSDTAQPGVTVMLPNEDR